jgi:hypothetical protein
MKEYFTFLQANSKISHMTTVRRDITGFFQHGNDPKVLQANMKWLDTVAAY